MEPCCHKPIQDATCEMFPSFAALTCRVRLCIIMRPVMRNIGPLGSFCALHSQFWHAIAFFFSGVP